MLTQIEELKSFITQAVTSSVKGPSSVTCDRVDRSTQIYATKAYVAKFTNTCAQYRAAEQNNNPQIRMQASGVKHRPLKRKSIEWTFVHKNKLKKGRGNVYKIMHVCLGRQLQEAKLILADENADAPIDCSPPCGQEPPQKNFPEVIILAGLGVGKCHGCGGNLKKKCSPQKDFEFHMQELCIWKDQKEE